MNSLRGRRRYLAATDSPLKEDSSRGACAADLHKMCVRPQPVLDLTDPHLGSKRQSASEPNQAPPEARAIRRADRPRALPGETPQATAAAQTADQSAARALRDSGV